jgi:hypothetical protein
MNNVITRLYPEYAPLFITSLDSLRTPAGVASGIIATLNEGSVSYPVANLALYIPLNLPWPYPINRWFWANATSGDHVDVGVYTQSGTKLASTGSIAQNGVNTSIQYVTTPTILLPAGSYYMGFSFDNTTHVRSANTGSPFLYRMLGLLQQTAAHPLPSSMSPAILTNGFWPLFGFTRTTSGF